MPSPSRSTSPLPPSRHRWARPVGAIPALLVAVTVVLAAPSAGAVSDGGAPPTPARPGVAPAYRPPLDRPVIDPFRPPSTPYGPGNRGLEYATAGGDVAGAIGAGVVTFAGDVAGRGVVTVVHPDGLRSSLTGLAVVLARRGQVVAVGAPLGVTGTRLHLGVRSGDRYIDPALLFGDVRPRHAVLVPGGGRPALGAPGPR